VITLRSEVRRPLVTAVSLWCCAALVVAAIAPSAWLLALALGGAVGSVLILAFALWPRRGDLERLVIDGRRRTLYWAHRGQEAEELPFSSLRAVAVGEGPGRRAAKLWAVDLSGRWVALGDGPRTSIEAFAGELAEAVAVPVWYKTEGITGAPPAEPQEVLPGGQPEEP
jgi:hypothetical protein